MKLRYIDSLRGFAVIGVMMVHCSQVGNNNYPFLIRNFFNNGSLGVQLFLIVSSFTLFLSYNNRILSEKNIVSNFFIRRFFRIAPLFYLAIVYYLYQDGWGPRPTLGDMQYVSSANIIAHFLFVHSINPYWINSIVPGGWSISIEIFFYLLVPLLTRKISSANRALYLLNISLVLKIISDLVMPDINHANVDGLWVNFIYYYFPTQFPVFCFGIFSYYLIQEKFSLHTINLNQLLVFSFLLILHQMFNYNSMILFVSIGYVILMYVLSKRSIKLFENKVLIFIGKLSYSLYLSHFAVLHFLKQMNLLDLISSDSITKSMINFSIRFSLLFGLSICISYLMYQLVEKPFIKLGKNIIDYFELKQIKA